MLHTTRLLIATACCGAFVFVSPASADGDGAGKVPAEKADGNKNKSGGDKGDKSAGEKAGGDKGEKANRENGDKGKSGKGDTGVKNANGDRGVKNANGDKGGASAEKGQPGKSPEQAQQQAPQQRRPEVRSRQFNERDYSRLKMGPNGPLPADKTKSAQARQDLETAKADLTKALSSTGGGNTAVQAENQLWRDSDYRQAALDLRRAHADYDNVRRPIFSLLREDSYYQELQKKQNDSQRVIQSLVLTGRSSFDYLFPHAMAALEMRKRMTRAEIIALAQAPEVEDARQRMLIAAAKVRSIKAGHMGQMNDPQLARKAKEDLDVARERVKQAQADLAAAQLDEAEYEKIRYNYVEEWRRTGTQPAIN